MSEVLSVFLLVCAVIASALVVLKRFKLPLQLEFGLGMCAIGLVLIADAVWSGAPVGLFRFALPGAGLTLILMSYRRARIVRNTGEPHVIDGSHLHKVSGGRKS